MKNLRWTILAALVLAVPSVAQAQRPDTIGGAPSSAPGGPGAPGAAGASGAAADSGSINSTGGATTDGSMSGTTNTTTPGMDTMGDSTLAGDSALAGDETTELANTGGEPFLMSLAGMSLLAGAFLLRRRVLS
ncbi:MAG TPA: LPXTG cell wall anchor domain-containing protein [Abditibacterium sp.]